MGRVLLVQRGFIGFSPWQRLKGAGHQLRQQWEPWYEGKLIDIQYFASFVWRMKYT